MAIFKEVRKMREILFRGKLKNGKWSYGNLEVKKDGVCIITPDDTPLGSYGQIDQETVGQYTGLLDKNGKRIFEGDIVQDISLFLIHKEYFEREMKNEADYKKYLKYSKPVLVEFCTEEFGSCGCCFDRFVGSGFKATDTDLTTCVVIGNIHDNPELIGGKEE